ncbi:casein kinase 2 regulatory subunit, partial [Ascosphaera aggregata]
VYPDLTPDKSSARYEPRVFGFKVHAPASLARWQDRRREEMVKRLQGVGIDGVFREDRITSDEDDEDDDDDDDVGEEEEEEEEGAMTDQRGNVLDGDVRTTTTAIAGRPATSNADGSRMEIGP